MRKVVVFIYKVNDNLRIPKYNIGLALLCVVKMKFCIVQAEPCALLS